MNKRFCKEPEKIENYEKALKDNFKGWHCHHRLETHTSGGERRPIDITQAELKALGMYYNRPPEELIFLTSREHNAYQKGKPKSEEARKKMGEAKKGNKYFLGKKHSDEAKKKMREAMKGKNIGKKRSEETRKKLSEVRKGTHWYNNGKINIRAKECPQGFAPGRIKKP